MQQRIARKSMPLSRNRLRFFLTWQRRERAMRSCVAVIISAVRSRNFPLTRPVSHKDRTSAEEAVRTWQTVNSGFFPPPQLMHLGQEQMTDRSNYQVPPQRFVVTNLEMAQAKFVFLILKAPLHLPAGKTDMKQHFQGSAFRGIGDKIFDFFGVFNIAGNNQPMCSR